jgi:transposase
MYIRKKKNQSGSYSVVLCVGERTQGKQHPISKVLKSFGATTDEKKLKGLLSEAEAYKQKLLAISPQVKSLKINGDADINSCFSYNVGYADVYGTAFTSIFTSLNLKEDILNKLRDLVIMRIANPCSKRRTSIIAPNYGLEFNVNNIYKLMDKLNKSVIMDMKKQVYHHTVKLLEQHKQSVDILFYDLTTIHFETNSQDELRDFGFSKDGKHQHVQIVLSAIVTKEGLPIDYEEFVGCTFEGHTLVPVINKLKQNYKINNVVIVADAALMNKVNLTELNNLGIKYIISARIKNSSKQLQSQILNNNGYTTLYDSCNSNTGEIDCIKSKTIVCSEDTLIAYYSSKRARKDYHDRESDLEKINKHLASSAKSKLTSRLRKPYITLTKDCKLEIDYNKFEKEAQYDGYFAFRTNINNPDAKEILTSYRGLWQIEQTFRIAKTNLDIRPVFHYTPRRIRAHFAICYAALALIRHVEYTLKCKGVSITFEQMHLMLERMRKVKIQDSNNHSFELLEDPPLELIKIYQALNISWHKKFKFTI